MNDRVQEIVAWATIKNGIPNAWVFNPEFVKNNPNVTVVLAVKEISRESSQKNDCISP